MYTEDYPYETGNAENLTLRTYVQMLFFVEYFKTLLNLSFNVLFCIDKCSMQPIMWFWQPLIMQCVVCAYNGMLCTQEPLPKHTQQHSLKISHKNLSSTTNISSFVHLHVPVKSFLGKIMTSLLRHATVDIPLLFTTRSIDKV